MSLHGTHGVSSYHATLSTIEKEDFALALPCDAQNQFHDTTVRIERARRLLCLALGECLSKKPIDRLCKIIAVLTCASYEHGMPWTSSTLSALTSSVAITTLQLKTSLLNMFSPNISDIRSRHNLLLESYFTYKSLLSLAEQGEIVTHSTHSSQASIVRSCLLIANKNPELKLSYIAKAAILNEQLGRTDFHKAGTDAFLDCIRDVHKLYIENGWFSRDDISAMNPAYHPALCTATLFFVARHLVRHVEEIDPLSPHNESCFEG